MELEVILEPAEEGGYTVSCPILQGCISEGDSRKEALVNIKDAISLYLQAIKKEVNPFSPVFVTPGFLKT
ncbi:MAG: type II toxin-antitoxin system HicB family antitoxin [Cytophagales bacterium]|nr:type II toxin-antitoxin system HicB family antitoxin [Cytophagales bacterium]